MAKIKDKERVLKATREKESYTQGKLSADFSSESLQARRECHNIFKALKGNSAISTLPVKVII